MKSTGLTRTGFLGAASATLANGLGKTCQSRREFDLKLGVNRWETHPFRLTEAANAIGAQSSARSWRVEMRSTKSPS